MLTITNGNCYELHQFITAEKLSLDLVFLFSFPLKEFTGEWDKSRRKLGANTASSKVHLSVQHSLQNSCDLILLHLMKKTEIK